MSMCMCMCMLHMHMHMRTKRTNLLKSLTLKKKECTCTCTCTCACACVHAVVQVHVVHVCIHNEGALKSNAAGFGWRVLGRENQSLEIVPNPHTPRAARLASRVWSESAATARARAERSEKTVCSGFGWSALLSSPLGFSVSFVLHLFSLEHGNNNSMRTIRRRLLPTDCYLPPRPPSRRRFPCPSRPSPFSRGT